MPSETALRVKIRRWALAALVAVLAAFLLATFTPLGLIAGFPPSVWWAQRLNRWEFQRHEQGYRDMVAWIAKEMAGVKPGTHRFYELSVTRDPSSLRLLEPPVPEATLIRLCDEDLLVEAHRFKGEFAVRFITRRLSDGRTFNLIHWNPAPNENCVFWNTGWWENEFIEWIDPQWWSTYCPVTNVRGWTVNPRGPEVPYD